MACSKPANILVREWRERRGVTLIDLSREIRDQGGQLQRWESGDRPTLPLKLKVRLSQHTGIPLVQLLGSDELEVAQRIFALMARDVAA